MLKSIECASFKQGGNTRGPIVFHKGLNTILGGVNGENSIGKSMLLLAIDFAFGGRKYKSCVFDEGIGNQELKVTFEFHSKCYYYIRSTAIANEVWICDENFNKKTKITLDEYKKMLLQYYSVNLPYLSFRNMIDRHFRIYGMDNCYEKEPLKVATEPKNIAIDAFLKLFDCYEQYKNADDEFKKVEKEKTTLKNAREMRLLPAEITSKKAFSENEEKIKEAETEVKRLLASEDAQLTKEFLSNSEDVGAIETELRILKRNRSWLINRLAIINDNIENVFLIDDIDLDDLLNFFPEANIKKISEIEHFHKKMQGILKQQMQIEASQVEKNISELNAKMEALMNKQHELGRTVTLSNNFLDKYNELIREISRLKKENQAFTQAENLKDKYKEQKNIKESIQKDVLKIVADKLNKQMENLCYMVYEGRKSAPVLDFKSGSKYSFTTENDAGMGTSFKSLIIFDISVLKLTVLPAIAHDTLMFKNIEDKHFKSILEIYSSFNDEPEDKQIFIACDKQDSYGDDVRNLLQNTCVIQLGPDGNELFGYSWAKRMEN